MMSLFLLTIPTRNRAEYLAAGVGFFLAMPREDVELIVCDASDCIRSKPDPAFWSEIWLCRAASKHPAFRALCWLGRRSTSYTQFGVWGRHLALLRGGRRTGSPRQPILYHGIKQKVEL
jgi:hypothetical protein